MFLKSKQQKALKSATKIANLVMSLEEKYSQLSDEDLLAKTKYFLDKIENGSTLEDIMVEAFAIAREAGFRAIGLKAYRVQVIGATLIARGHIAEMQTGEGKTLTEIMPAYLLGLFKKGVHIVTANDYLAKRDCEWMKPVYDMLGMSSSYVISTSTKQERKEAYLSDITYVTNNELAFDYLRDNMVTHTNDIVLNSRFGYAIIDEADSILIDEARTPFIISSKSSDRVNLFSISDKLVRLMQRGEDLKELGKMEYLTGMNNEDAINEGDYRVDLKNKSVILTKQGTLKAEKFFNCGFLSNPENSEIMHCILTSLKAHTIMQKEKDYIVKDGEVLCVDAFTGRIQKGRRFISGLHQAIEAKENVEIKPETLTTATITFQTLFNMYFSKSGMTGTAMTEAKELMEIYGLMPVAVPTNVPSQRTDIPDAIYRSCMERDIALVDLVEEEHSIGRPILVGTPSIEASERISNLLTKRGIKHNVLNAKNHELEAEIIAQAGQKGAITVATNMAGRGTDIKIAKECENEGLLVIGSARHDSRRIDNQLRGRSGRQGDKGDTIFMLACDDELIDLFAGNRIKSLIETLKLPEGTLLTHPLISKNIEMAQKIVENQNFETRKKLYEYDTIISGQCNVIYGLRDSTLKGGIIKEIPETIADSVDWLVCKSIKNGLIDKTILDNFFVGVTELNGFYPNDKEDITDYANRLCQKITQIWRQKRDMFENEEEFEEFCSIIFLKTLDKYWAKHINAMTELRKNIHLQSYAQKDPLVEYKTEGGEMFTNMLNDFKPEVVKSLLIAKIIKTPIETNNLEDNKEN